MVKTALIVVFSIASAVLVFLLFFSMPSQPAELILNEKSYLEVLNETDYNTILAKRFFINSAKSLSPNVLKAQEDANKMTEFAVNTHSLFQEAISLCGYPDSILKKSTLISDAVAKASGIRSPPELLTRMFKDKLEDPNLYRRSKIFQGLPLLLLENDLLYAINEIMDSISEETSMIGVDDSFLLKNIKRVEIPSWINGQIAFNPPVLMNLCQKERIQVRISKKYSEELVKSMAGNNSAASDSPSLGNILLVKLLGEDFTIVAYDAEEQGVTYDGYTQWEFDVMAKTSGNHELYIKPGVIYYVPNLGPVKKYFPAYEKVVHVEVSTWQIIAGFTTTRWGFLTYLIFIPLAVWGVFKLRSRKNPASDNTTHGN